MKAYYIGGSMDQMKAIVDGDHLENIVRFARAPARVVAAPYPPKRGKGKQMTEMVQVVYEYYTLLCCYTPEGEAIAFYFFDPAERSW